MVGDVMILEGGGARESIVRALAESFRPQTDKWRHIVEIFRLPWQCG